MTTETSNEEKQLPESQKIPEKDNKRPALTVVFQTWSTPIVGIVMLIVGLFGGYFGREIIVSDTTAQVVEEIDTSSNDNSPITPPASDEDLVAKQQEFMAIVVGNTRHFRGEPDAPVTIIEFSDFL